MKFPFSELDYDNLYPLSLKLESGNIYEGRFTDLRIDRSSIPKDLGLYVLHGSNRNVVGLCGCFIRWQRVSDSEVRQG